jgi:predicted nucleic acid-binding protein
MDGVSRATSFMNAVDTNVFVYVIDSRDPAKHTKAIALLKSLGQPPISSVLPWQVAGEFLNCLLRWSASGFVSPADVALHLQDVLTMFPLAMPTQRVLEIALDLHVRHSLSHWDSMLLAACIVAGVDTLYSEDLTDGATYETVKVINPFA